MLLGQNPTRWMRSLNESMTERFMGNANAMKRLAITESGRVQIEAQRESYNQYGYDQYEVICEPDACPVCRVHDGEIYETKNMRHGENSPMFHPFCKCSTAAYMDRKEVDDAIAALERAEWKSRAIEIERRDINIARSLGAAAVVDRVKLPDGKYGRLKEGTKIIKVVVFAGKGTNTTVKVAHHLEREYGAPASEWKKVRGEGIVINGNVEKRAELHWFEADSVGRKKMKVKRYFDD